MRHYRRHFIGKTVLCNCDDPYESNFFKYFVLNFNRLGLKKLIATCYVDSPIACKELPLFASLDEGKKERIGATPYKAVVTTVYDKTGDGSVDMLDVAELFKSGENELTELKGDGDFRSEECLALLDEADIVVTNPPFSLFREYLNVLIKSEKRFIIIGNVNAITYKEVFPLLMHNKMWIGASIHSGDRAFFVPDDYPLDAAGCGIDEETGRKFIRVKGVRWFTNLDIKQRHEEIILVRQYDKCNYPCYDNYNAINVDVTADIPRDYAGTMGVPITFLDKYSPDQFEILGIAKAGAGDPSLKTKEYPVQKQVDKNGKISSVRKLNDGPAIKVLEPPKGSTYYMIGDEYYIQAYARILIRNKHPEPPKED